MLTSPSWHVILTDQFPAVVDGRARRCRCGRCSTWLPTRHRKAAGRLLRGPPAWASRTWRKRSATRHAAAAMRRCSSRRPGPWREFGCGRASGSLGRPSRRCAEAPRRQRAELAPRASAQPRRPSELATSRRKSRRARDENCARRWQDSGGHREDRRRVRAIRRVREALHRRPAVALPSAPSRNSWNRGRGRGGPAAHIEAFMQWWTRSPFASEGARAGPILTGRSGCCTLLHCAASIPEAPSTEDAQPGERQVTPCVRAAVPGRTRAGQGARGGAETAHLSSAYLPLRDRAVP